ncbi:MAG: hypothetical protein ACC707_18740, partial [Thiohalomonadales bacterium]
LSSIQSALSDAAPHFQNKSVTYQVSYKIIKKHVEKLIEIYNEGHFNHFKSMMRSTGGICASCHTQDRAQRTLFGGVTRGEFSNDFEFAEFNFITRDYSAAVQYYSRYFDSLTSHQQEKYQLSALRNVLTIYVQIYNEPRKAIEAIERYLKNDKFSTYVRKTLEKWVSGLKLIEKAVEKNLPITYSRIEADVNKYLLPNQTFSKIEYHLWLKGRMYRYLSTTATKKQIPALLYWLSIASSLTDTSYYYSLADLYLKQCMREYTTDPYAKKCYEQYNENVVNSFSGSHGTDIPDSLLVELDELHQLVFGAPRSLE